MIRRQLPVHSPLPLRAVAAGLLGLFARDDTDDPVIAALRGHYGASRVLLTDSGTSALGLALAGVSLRAPDAPVALPAYGCFDIATAAEGAGAKVMLYDIDPDTLGPEPQSLRAALHAGARCVVVAHLYGVPVDLDPVLGLAREHDALVIDDAAQGAGATYRSRPLGSYGGLGVLSFGRGKGITGSGGGALLVNDAAGAAVVERLRLPRGRRGTRALAGAAAQWLLGRPAIYGVPQALPFLRLGETIYRPPSPPRGMSGASRCILRATLPLAAEESRLRRAHAARLLASLEGDRRRWAPRVATGGDASYLRLPLVLPGAALERTRNAKRLGVMPAYPRPLTALPGFGARAELPRGRPLGAERLARHLYTLPTHSLLSEGDLRRLEEWLRSLPE